MVEARVHAFPAPGGPIDVVVSDGEAIDLRGPSGSGKTSLLRALAGLGAPRSPQWVSVDGSDPATWPARQVAHSIGLVPQDASDGLVGLTVAGEYRFRGRTPCAGDQDVATLSSGEARKLVIDLVSDRPLLLLDEPAEGLDAAGLATLRHTIAHRRGSVVFVDHDGRLADLASRTIELAPTVVVPLPGVGPGGAHTIIRCPAATVQLGGTRLDLPAIEAAGGLHLLRGPNGCGKTTMLRRLAGLDPAPVEVDGVAPVPGRNTRWTSARARDHLSRTTVAHELQDTEDWVTEALVGVSLDRHPLRLAGGEAQRVALAKALGQPARAYLLDEPEAHLDSSGRAALVAVIARRIEQGAAIVVASHDPAWQEVAHQQVWVQA